MNLNTNKKLIILTLSIVISLSLFLPIANAQTSCRDKVTEAENAQVGGNYEESAALYREAADCYKSEGRYRQCSRYYQEASEIDEEIGSDEEKAYDLSQAAECSSGNNKRNCGQYASEAGQIYQSLGEYSEALKQYNVAEKCYGLSQMYNEKANVKMSAGDIHITQEDHSSALNEYLGALEAVNKESSYKISEVKCSLLEKTGATHEFLNNHSKSWIYYLNASKCYIDNNEENKCIETGKASREGASSNNTRKAMTYEAMGNCYPNPQGSAEEESSGLYHKKAAEEYLKAGEYIKSGENYKKAGESYSQKSTNSKEMYVKCAGSYLKEALSNEEVEDAINNLVETEQCYDSAGMDEHENYVSQYKDAWINNESLDYFEIESLAENPEKIPESEDTNETKTNNDEGANQDTESNIIIYIAIIAVILISFLAFWLLSQHLKEKNEEVEEETNDEEKADYW